MKIRLVDDWRHWWRWNSTKMFVALGALPTIWAEIPTEWKAEFPSSWMRFAALGLMFVGIASRMTLQKAPPEKDKNK
ncbi:hypothetical protein [Yokenella regensburgei]|uniref:DUF7940 domain-containing protein n=1 Tax=Yokenella regensburgei TaxID=158877 RepID=UPI001433018B|nr:hypothetical protein [Yokenella regensburgei]QIU92137.1 hypothetical protein HEC60_23825 [Yokenella regensburgei]